MTIDNLKKGVELWEKSAFIRKQIKSLNEQACIILGSERLDKYDDVHERLKNAIKATLLDVQTELDIQIEKL